MFLSNLLRRIREKNERKDILRTLIESLRIDENQRFLYLESLELLDDDGLAAFYARLVTFVDEKECGNIISEWDRRFWIVRELMTEEAWERKKDEAEAWFLFDNL